MNATSGVTILNGLPTLEAVLRRQLGIVVSKATQDAAANAISEIQTGEKSGFLYRRGEGFHQASAPGEAPASDMGNLASGIRGAMVDPLTGEVTVASEYGPVLEFGGAEIEPRPFLQPAVELVDKPFRRAVQASMRKAKKSAENVTRLDLRGDS